MGLRGTTAILATPVIASSRPRVAFQPPARVRHRRAARRRPERCARRWRWRWRRLSAELCLRVRASPAPPGADGQSRRGERMVIRVFIASSSGFVAGQRGAGPAGGARRSPLCVSARCASGGGSRRRAGDPSPSDNEIGRGAK
ncbi:hypothetical protein J1605_015000 [Eschrichtius robustus]|uniref:Uncharacterized protein n=1 Tax=Eschrichtius robustus TaxID=9764 RepID=A0AB34GCD3_ESCRO|nr:hypothetical protein J1605_015000 [Eschrichtius robustus]